VLFADQRPAPEFYDSGMSGELSVAAPRAFPLAAADQCVKCGMCLPHCPTYRITLDEGESPRGRIALMHALATGAVPPNEALQGHLDRCLTCRACEVVCPADVPYGRLIDASRAQLAEQVPQRGRVPRVMAAVMTQRPLRFAVAAVLWLYQRLGLQWLVRATGVLGRGRLARLESLLPDIHLPHLPEGVAAGGGASVDLFANCTSPLVEPATLEAATRLLWQLGCSVRVPETQACCGAIDQHAGFPAAALRCAERNVAAFAGGGPIVGVASGCTAQLLDYPLLTTDPAAAAFAARVQDVHGFIAAHPALPQLRFRPLDARVLLHTPCTLRNVVRGEGAVRALLERIPGLRIQGFDTGCCGAAGSYFLTQPAMADALAQVKVDQAAAARPDYVLSSNAGCAMHLGAALRRAGVTVPVCHPLRLLAQQLEN
jgi:glycolate oxidase iron-sulfur subunit